MGPTVSRRDRAGNRNDGWLNARRDAHADIDRIFDHHGPIVELAEGRGLSAGRLDGSGGSKGGYGDPTGEGALRRDRASDWLKEFVEARAHWTSLAQRTHLVDPLQAKNVRRGDDVEKCVLCGDVIGQGLNGRPDCHRVNSHALHANTCYYQVYRQAAASGVTVQALVERLAGGRR